MHLNVNDADLSVKLDDLTLLLHNIIKPRKRSSSTTGHPFQKLPLELIEYILFLSGVGVVSLSVVNRVPFKSGDNAVHSYLTLPVFTTRSFPLYSISVDVESKDQGWSSYRAEQGKRNSSTWGELVTVHGSQEKMVGKAVEVFRNIHAGRVFERQTKELSTNMEPIVSLNLLREEKFGGSIGADTVWLSSAQRQSDAAPSSTDTSLLGKVVLVLMLRSCYPGWRINVNAATVVISYSFQFGNLNENHAQSYGQGWYARAHFLLKGRVSTMFVTVTMIELNSLLHIPALVSNSIKIANHMVSLGHPKVRTTGWLYRHHTLSTWQSREEMRIFFRCEPHMEAIRLSKSIAKEVKVLTFECDPDAVPTWPEAIAKCDAEGKSIKFDT